MREDWSLDIKKMSWVEHTVEEVDFIIEALALRGGERVLDLACGFGRHSLELARRGYKVVGVDITPEYIADARRTAQARGRVTLSIGGGTDIGAIDTSTRCLDAA